MKKILFLLCFITLCSASLRAQYNNHTADSLAACLPQCTTPADSLVIYTNLYDVLPSTYSRSIGLKTYELATRAGDQLVAMEMLRNLGNRAYRDANFMRQLNEYALQWPDTEERKETVTFLHMMDNIRKGRYESKEGRKAFLDSLMNIVRSGNTKRDLYSNIEVLHGICMLLTQTSGSGLIDLYTDSLGSLVRSLPPNAYSIRNAYCVHSSTLYAGINPAKSIEIDKRLLYFMEQLDKYYKEKGRVFHNFNRTNYIIYTRLLSNFEELTPFEVEDYYKKVLSYIKLDPSIEAAFEKFPAADIYYSLAKKNYAKASELMRRSSISEFRQPQVLRQLIKCAHETGDDKLLVEATTAYNKVLENMLNEQAEGAVRELQVAYSIYDLQNRVNERERESAENVATLERSIIVISVVACVAMLILVLLLLSKSRSNSRLARSLAESNDQLKAESENLKISREELLRAKNRAEKANNLKDDFIKNMSYEVKIPLQAITEYSRLIVDCAVAMGTKYIVRFADMLELNTELLSNIINDVLRLTDMEASPIPVHRQVVNLQLLSSASIASVAKRVQPGVEMKLDPECGQMDFFTDPTRVQQVLNNLLSNAAKFTHSGSIVLGYRNNEEKDRVEFTVTDTGIGINPDNKEKIFERFVKLDRESQGAGLGLTIARIIARRLGGDIYLDTTYKGHGSRFVFFLNRN